MHVGNARTALLAWLQVRSAGGTMVMRIEDLDRGRCHSSLADALLEDLRWLGLDWDEGPDVGGPFGPYRQSERESYYAAALAKLAVFPCGCTRSELRTATIAPYGSEPIYPGTCRNRPAHPDRRRAWRWEVPIGVVEVDDLVMGRCTQDVAKEIGDFALRRNDGAWAYQLAVVVDDAAMEITHVTRGADLWTSTPRQVLLQRALGLPRPIYAHVPLVLNDRGDKLSKRSRPPGLDTLRAAGVDPRRVVAALARSVGLAGPEVQTVDARALVADFDLVRVSPQSGDVEVAELGDPVP